MQQAGAFGPIIEIMERHGVRCSPEEFHAAVNVTFHQFESEVYDDEHRDMWQSLPREFALLASDCEQAGLPASASIRMLDIGCGTGLASDSMLKSVLGPRIREITLLDTSSAMLRRVSERAKTWGVPVQTHEGLLNSLPLTQFDVIVTCSVLHHVPDLPGLLEDVRRRQAPGGVFIHIQDPNGDMLGGQTLQARMKRVPPQPPEWAQKLNPARIIKKIRREMGKPDDDYVAKANQELLRLQVLQTPLSVAELYAITDIHVVNGQGISLAKLKEWMSPYRLVSDRSYGFFGPLASDLPPELQREEDVFSQQRDKAGAFLSAAWAILP
jgi:2-polyprenyl-3-methyl-5-hydroxy-6-metoxy-1,4-benzoquinol methylase